MHFETQRDDYGTAGEAFARPMHVLTVENENGGNPDLPRRRESRCCLALHG